MKKLFLLGLAVLLLAACKSGKKSMTGDEVVTVVDFVDFFQELTPPYALADTQINRKLSDSLLIDRKVLSQFIPDTVYQKDFANGEPKFYALGKMTDKQKKFLLVKAATQEHQIGYLTVFDKDNVFRGAMPFVRNNRDRKLSIKGSINKRLTITTSETTLTGGAQYYKLHEYMYNDGGGFVLIKIESNEPLVPKEVYNPFDTLPQTHEHSGDYIKDKKNFVSIRDAENERKFLFFIHFDRGDECSGEIKGEATWIKPNVAQFRQTGNACILEMSFAKNGVTLREEQACGNYRGLKCEFAGTFAKKKAKEEKKPAKKK